MPKLLIRTALIALTALATALPATAQAAPSASACPGADSSTTTPRAQINTMRCLVNATRHTNGLATLATHPKLARAAQLKGQRIQACGTFSHTPCGAPFTAAFRAAGWHGTMAENIAFGQAAQGTPRAILSAWLASPGHRANLLNRAYHVHGLAVRTATLPGIGTVTLWIHTFGA